MPDPCTCGQPVEIVTDILRVSERLNDLKDVDAILDRILTESRRLSGADAGTIFLLKDDALHFSYVHNDTLFRDEANKHVYMTMTVDVNEHSIVGYVAKTGELLAIDDAYDLDPALPFSFNRSFDERTGYRTRSILTIPVKSSQARIVGVMQLINSKDASGASGPFSDEARTYLPLLANNASVAIERGIMTRELILRMMQMAEMRDPSETGAHVQRVGAYSAEIYDRWARTRGIDRKEIKRYRDLLRVAAMLHDVGKVGVSDLILKKPGKLTDEEFATMKLHTVNGARLFLNATSELDAMSREIALNHHEKWNGKGYPGAIPDLGAEDVALGVPKRGEEIPLAARFVALADVFDALCSRRSYKAEWSDEKILDLLREEKGEHFDPEVVDAFLDIFDVITAIREKFREEGGVRHDEIIK
ncbi:MAG: HD domain-containing protein [Desulfovibrionaceae bacterium]|jgi:HD-GYP domain-containing protein (c-di-GMP phosphodiesterase class II)|nr:HD domain-containing protein [Desulfovibrionaceae bacterium]